MTRITVLLLVLVLCQPNVFMLKRRGWALGCWKTESVAELNGSIHQVHNKTHTAKEECTVHVKLVDTLLHTLVHTHKLIYPRFCFQPALSGKVRESLSVSLSLLIGLKLTQKTRWPMSCRQSTSGKGTHTRAYAEICKYRFTERDNSRLHILHWSYRRLQSRIWTIGNFWSDLAPVAFGVLLNISEACGEWKWGKGNIS